MKLFNRREIVFEARDKAGWEAARAALRAAGVEILEANSFETEQPICGCGPRLDSRDFGPAGRIDRLTYYVAVRPEDAQRARELLAAAH
jgi:hypothetical protein